MRFGRHERAHDVGSEECARTPGVVAFSDEASRAISKHEEFRRIIWRGFRSSSRAPDAESRPRTPPSVTLSSLLPHTRLAHPRGGMFASRVAGGLLASRPLRASRARRFASCDVGASGGSGARGAPPSRPSIQTLGSAARVEVMRPKPLFTVGLFADAQYADKDDHERPDEPGRVKYFRAAPARLAEALAAFKREAESMACIVNLGDLVDGVNDDDVHADVPTRRGPVPEHMAERNRADLERMARVLREGAGSIPVHHCLGNHDLNVPRDECLLALGGPDHRPPYYSVKLPRGWRLIVLDTTDVNPRYADVGSEAQAACEAYVRDASRYGDAPLKPWGGGVGPAQFEWLSSELDAAVAAKERVIVASHVALSPTAARPGMAAWNAPDVSRALEACPAVALCLAGHDHPGGYGRTLVTNPEDGLHTFGRVHFVTLEAMLEAPETSYAVLEVYEHEAIVRGIGSATTRRLRTSPNGVFTGVASFGRVADIVEDATEGNVRVETSEMGLLDWINAHRGDMRGDGGPDITLT